MVSRNYDLSQTPGDSILIFPEVLASPPAAGSFLGAVTSSTKLAQLGFFAPGAVYLPIAGGTMTGPLILSRDPQSALEASTKRYTDLMLPLTGGQMSGPLSLFGDGTQPLHAVTFQQLNVKLNIAGGTMTGNLFLNANPGSPLQAATKSYVDAQDIAVTAAYLPLTGGTLTGAVIGVSYSVPSTVFASATEPDMVWSIRDGAGNIALAFISPGILTAQVRLLADPVQPTDAATKRYVDTLTGSTGLYLPLTGGALTGALTGTTFAIPTAVWSTSTEPDLVWSVRDGNGNIAVAISPTGALNAAALTTASLSLTGPLTAPSVTATTGNFTNLTATASATMAGDIRAATGTLPDLVGGFEQDASGGVVKGYSADGVMHVVGLAANSVTINGVPLTGGGGAASAVPLDAIDVRATAYNAKGDANESYAYATTSGTSLTLVNYSGTVSLSQLNPTTALLTLDGATRWSGWAPQPSDIGETVYLTAGAYTLTALVQKYIDGQTLWLTASGITPQTSVAGTVTLPTFAPTDVGKSLIVDGMGQNAWWSGTFNSRIADAITPYGQQTFVTTIATVISPNQITTGTSFPFSWTSRSTRLMWGTNDGNAVALAANDAFYGGKRKIWFSGDNRLYLLLGLVASGPAWLSYTPTITTDATALLNGVLWGADNARTFACNGGVLGFRHRTYQPGAVASRDAPKLTHGRLSLPRCAQLTTMNVCITGDSLGTYNPQSQASSVMNTARFMQEFRQQNPGKIINFYNIAIGGKTFADLTNPGFVLTDTSGFADAWNIPRPIVGTIKYIDLFANLNRTATSATNPIVPDLVVILENGGNDAWGMDGASIQAMINLARRATHADSFGPTDILMQTDHHAIVTRTWTVGISGGVALAAVHDRSFYEEYAAGLIRSAAWNRGFGCIDLEGLIDRAVFGFDPTRRTMRQIPSFTLSATPTTPVAWLTQCRDFSAWLSTPSASTDAAAWTSLGQLDITLSEHQGNRLMLRMGTNGNLWLGQSAYGGTTATVTTLTSGSKTITFAAPTSFPGVIMQMSEEVRQLYLMSGTGVFTAPMNGQCLVGPFGALRSAVYQPQRTYIRQVMDTNNAMLYDTNAANASFNSLTATITIGGQTFIPQDGNSMPDVVIYYPDGTVFNTQVDWNGYISATSATLVDAAPQSLAGISVPVFLGRMGIKWYDTGLKLSTTTNTGFIELSINRCDLMLGYAPDMVKSSNIVPMTINRPLEHFGGPFNPVFRAQGTQDIQLTNLWVDGAMPYAPSCTPWELRGIADTNSDYASGGVGGHYGSRLRTEILDPFYATQNFSTG